MHQNGRVILEFLCIQMPVCSWVLFTQPCPDLQALDTSSFLFPVLISPFPLLPPKPPLTSHHGMHSAFCQQPHWNSNRPPRPPLRSHNNGNTKQQQKRRLSFYFVSLKPHKEREKKQTTKTSQSEDSCLYPPVQCSDQVFFFFNCLWSESKGYGRVLFL